MRKIANTSASSFLWLLAAFWGATLAAHVAKGLKPTGLPAAFEGAATVLFWPRLPGRGALSTHTAACGALGALSSVEGPSIRGPPSPLQQVGTESRRPGHVPHHGPQDAGSGDGSGKRGPAVTGFGERSFPETATHVSVPQPWGDQLLGSFLLRSPL